MYTLKSKIKRYIPDCVLYLFYIIRLIPKYIRSVVESNKYSFNDISFYSDIETVDLIINERKSLSRYGDGEFMWMTGEKLDSYQDYSEEFSTDLKKAFQSKNDKLLIGIPIGLFDSSKCNLYAKMHWSIIKSDFYTRLVQFVDFNKIYCNASITRPYIDYRDYKYSTNCFNNLKRIWNGKDIVFVEGEKTKLGVGNDLFDNAKSIKRIICPATNAYSQLEKIEDTIKNNVDKSELILSALGPTASILAARMTDLGYQVVDIGHIDIEYSWYLSRSILRDEVPGKYVNESGKKDCSRIYDNDCDYKKSIICKVL